MTRFCTIISSILLSFFTLSNVFAATPATSIELSASKTQVIQGESFSLSVSIKKKGDSNINISDVNIPGIDAFEIHGTSSSTQILAIGNENAIETMTTYSVAAKKEGTFTVGPVIFQDGKQQLKSNSLLIVVSANTNQKVDKLQNISDSNPETNDWSLKDWLKISGIFLSIIIVILFILIYHYEKSKKVTKDFPIQFNLENSEKFSTKESIIKIIRENLSARYSVDTSSFTYSELITTEKKLEKKILLKEILLKIQHQEYGNIEIDFLSLQHLVTQFIQEK